MKLYFVQMKVRPEVDHPMYWDLDSGWLQAFLFATDDGDAGAKAKTLTKLAGWELLEVEKILPDDNTPPADPIFVDLIKEAKESGFAFRVIGVFTGVDPSCQPPE